MFNYFLKLKRKKGFTLVELIIVVAIIAVLMASIAALSGPIRRMINRTTASSDAISANTIMGNYIENRLAFASKLEIYCAINPLTASGSTSVITSFDNMKSRLNMSGNEKDSAGILIFHYENDTIEPEKSHYEIYDVPIRKTSTSFNDCVIDGTELEDDNAVFIHDFYKFSQNMIIVPTEATKNNIRNDVYMSIDIIPYNFNPEFMVYDGNTIDTTVDQYISYSKLFDYYAYKYERDQEIAAGGPVTYTDETCGLSTLDIFRTGPKETLTFELQNIMTTSTYDPVAKLDQRFIVTNCASGASASIMGSDIMIFYYTPHY